MTKFRLGIPILIPRIGGGGDYDNTVTTAAPSVNEPPEDEGTSDEGGSYFSRTELTILIVASVLFLLFFVILCFRLCQIFIYRIKIVMDGEEGSRARRVSARERRVSGFLERPGVRDILANRVREARVMENREEAKRRARVERVEPHVASVVRMAPSPSLNRYSPHRESSSSSRVPPTPPPAYDSQVDSAERASICSEGPPPSYHSKMGDE